MTMQETLERVEEDIKNDDLGTARDRLNGLICSYPNELSLRRMLGDIYSQLKYPVMAGRYWYLEEMKTPDMDSACKTFEKECANQPHLILQSLKFKGNLMSIESQYARKLLIDLGWKNPKHDVHPLEDRRKLKNKLYSVILIFILLCMLSFFVIGLWTVMIWILKSIQMKL